MGLFDYLSDNNLLKYNGNIILNQKQQLFCDRLLKDNPLLLKYDINRHVHDRILLYPIYENHIPVGITGKDNHSYYNIFNIENKPIKEWKSLDETGFTILKDMSCGNKVNLLPIIKKWLILYERELKLNTIFK